MANPLGSQSTRTTFTRCLISVPLRAKPGQRVGRVSPLHVLAFPIPLRLVCVRQVDLALLPPGGTALAHTTRLSTLGPFFVAYRDAKAPPMRIFPPIGTAK